MTNAVDGLDDLDKDIIQLVQKISGTELQAMTQSAAGEILNEIELMAPVNSGALKASIKANSRHGYVKATTSIQVSDSKKGGIEHYAVFLEYGTCKMPPHPFMRPAFESSKARAVETFASELDNVIRSRT